MSQDLQNTLHIKGHKQFLDQIESDLKGFAPTYSDFPDARDEQLISVQSVLPAHPELKNHPYNDVGFKWTNTYWENKWDFYEIKKDRVSDTILEYQFETAYNIPLTFLYLFAYKIMGEYKEHVDLTLSTLHIDQAVAYRHNDETLTATPREIITIDGHVVTNELYHQDDDSNLQHVKSDTSNLINEVQHRLSRILNKLEEALFGNEVFFKPELAQQVLKLAPDWFTNALVPYPVLNQRFQQLKKMTLKGDD